MRTISVPPAFQGRARVCVVICALALAVPALSAAPSNAAGSIEGGNAFSELERQAEEQPTTTQTTSTSTETTREPTNSNKTLVIVLGAAVVLLSGIGLVIVRDARRVAPAGDTDMVEARAAADKSIQQRKRRAKAKAARQQRKRSR